MTDPQVIESITRTETIVTELKDHLLGGPGREGVIPELRRDVSQLKSDRDKAKTGVGIFKWAVSAIGLTELAHIFWRK